MPNISALANSNVNPIAIAIKNQQNSTTKRASLDESYDIHNSYNASFGSSPKQSPLH